MNVACCFRSLHTTFPPLLVETPCKSSVAEGGGVGSSPCSCQGAAGPGLCPPSRPVFFQRCSNGDGGALEVSPSAQELGGGGEKTSASVGRS